MRMMEFDQYITPDNRVYSFENGTDKFVWGVTGRGMSPLEYRTQRGPFQHGVTPLDFVLEPRTIQMVHRINAIRRADYWDNRESLLDWLRPNRSEVGQLEIGTLRKIKPDGSMRDISVLIELGPAFRPSKLDHWDEFAIEEGLRFIAFDPTFYNPDKIRVDLNYDISDDEIVFPFTFPFTFQSSGLEPTDTITYTGTWLSYPTILLTGPMTNPVVHNITTQEKLELTYTIPTGRQVTINLTFGNKTIINDLGVNLIGVLTTDSDLSTFHLEPSPGAAGGINQFGLAASNKVIGTTRFTFEYFTRYIGI